MSIILQLIVALATLIILHEIGHFIAARLVKVDVDKAPDISAQLQIKSIPTVYAFRDGQPVDGFQGALPESQIKAWVDQLIKVHGGAGAAGPSPLDEALDAADTAMNEGDISSAGALYAQVLNQEPENLRALSGMARAYVKGGAIDKARELIDAASDEARASEDLKSVISAVELAETGAANAGEIDALRATVEADPADHQARFDYAVAAYAAGDPVAAIDALNVPSANVSTSSSTRRVNCPGLRAICRRPRWIPTP